MAPDEDLLPQVSNLEALAGHAGLGPLGEAERRLLRGAPTGEPVICGPSRAPKDPTNDPAGAQEWGADREIRADLIRWLCVDRLAATRIDPKGIQILGAKIAGILDIAFVSVPFRIIFRHCCLTDDVRLNGANVPDLSFEGSCVRSVMADRVNIKGSFLLRDGFTAQGVVRLPGADIGGDLDCRGGTFKNPAQGRTPDSGKALGADGATVRGNVFLNKGFFADGEVRLPGSQIGCDLSCRNGTFRNPARRDAPESGKALNIGGASVNRHVFLDDSFLAEGELHLKSARIGGDLKCDGGTFTNPLQDDLHGSGTALNLDSASVKGTVFLNRGFAAQGDVWLCAAQIGHLECRGGKANRLIAQSAHVVGNLFLGLDKSTRKVTIDLTNTSTGAMADDEASWPEVGNLVLDGFTYGRIIEGPTGADKRLEWLARQRDFRPQPYKQLANALRAMGDDHGAKRVLYEMERRRHEGKDLGRFERMWTRFWLWLAGVLSGIWGWLLKWTIGYGYYPLRAFGWLLALTILGAVLFHYGYRAGAMMPVDEKAYTYFQQHHEPPPYQQQFNSIVYSLENSVPFLRLWQDSAWTPDPAARPSAHWWLTWPTLLRCFRRIEIVSGWILATLFLAGVTGIVRRE